MSTDKITVAFILGHLGNLRKFSARAMFGEYALYADEKIVGLICDDQLYVKILPASQALETLCEKDAPYPGAKLHYLIEESQLSLENLPTILLAVAKAIPAKKKK
jgi:TfoX/Sxy family transcriptional regulator of competence genes